jgi:hypothetical protein
MWSGHPHRLSSFWDETQIFCCKSQNLPFPRESPELGLYANCENLSRTVSWFWLTRYTAEWLWLVGYTATREERFRILRHYLHTVDQCSIFAMLEVVSGCSSVNIVKDPLTWIRGKRRCSKSSVYPIELLKRGVERYTILLPLLYLLPEDFVANSAWVCTCYIVHMLYT